MNLLHKTLIIQYDKLNNLYEGNIPMHIKNRIEFFKELDMEYCKNVKVKDDMVMFSSESTNKSWRGFWLKATGMDEYLYIFYLVYGREMQIIKENIDIVDMFRKTHPNEKFIPYSISVINQDLLGEIDDEQIEC